MRPIITLIVFIIGITSCIGQKKINGVAFPENYTAGKDQLVLNGGGTRVKYFMDMYVAALYLGEKSSKAPDIVASAGPVAIRICILSGMITSSKMITAVEEGFKKSTDGHPEKFKDEIELFKKAFSDEIKKSDIFDIVYSEEKLTIFKNGKIKAEIKGHEFKKAAIGIWLGEDPADSDLKEGMLGLKE